MVDLAPDRDEQAAADSGASDVSHPSDSSYDASDAAFDSGFDAGLDSGQDGGGGDSGSDAGWDAGKDAGADAGKDAGLDSGFDAGQDAGWDGGFDAGLVFEPSLADLWAGRARFVADTAFKPPAELYGHAETFTVPYAGKYHMYYRTFVDQPGGNPAIGLATSTDGDNWSAYNGGKPVVPRGGAPGGIDDGYLISPAVHAEGAALTMVYEAWAGSGKQTVAAAMSNDGLVWTKLGTVVPASSSGWEKGNTGTPSINLVNGTWFVFYHGFRGTDGTGALARGFASGNSISSLTKHGAPVLSGTPGTWTDVGIGRGDIIREGGWWYMVYEGAKGSALCNAQAQYGWGIARSADLVNWEEWPYNPVLTDTDGSCGNDMPVWQVIGKRAMVVTTRFDTNGVRRLKLIPSVAPGTVLATYEVETDLSHLTGAASGTDWVAYTPRDQAGALAYGPYVTTLQAGVAEARFLIAGGIDPPSSVLATLDVNDVTENHRLRASLDVTGTMLPASAYKEFSLPFLIPPDNHSLEFRIWWKGAGMIRADKVTIVAK